MNLKGSKNRTWQPYIVMVALLHIIGISFLIIGGQNSAMLISMAFISYTLGLRHAFDVDHIAAIDNTVRKLIQQKKNSSGVGFYFSIGHSSVVFLMAVLTALSVKWAQRELPQFEEVGGIVGALVSGCFLVLIGLINIVILKDLGKLFFKMRQGQYDQKKVEAILLSRGLLGRFFSPLFKLVNKSWHVYPLGFLFGLGFDTASEVALLAISAAAVKQSISFIGLLSLPILFAAGMSLMDTADGIFMERAYQWAFSTPVRKVYYNLTITSVSVFAALFIGLMEIIQVLSEQFNLNGGIWTWIQNLSLGWLGYTLVALFLLSWLTSYGIWRFLKIEERWG